MIYDLVVSSCIATEAAAHLAGEHRAELLKRYAPAYIDKAADRKHENAVLPELKDIRIIREIGSGGINEALWDSAQELKCGLRIDLYEIPVFQDTIEICNTLDMDPYVLDSKGSYLIYARCGLSVVRELKAAGFKDAALIGHTTDDKKRLIIYGDVERFLTPPGRG